MIVYPSDNTDSVDSIKQTEDTLTIRHKVNSDAYITSDYYIDFDEL